MRRFLTRWNAKLSVPTQKHFLPHVSIVSSSIALLVCTVVELRVVPRPLPHIPTITLVSLLTVVMMFNIPSVSLDFRRAHVKSIPKNVSCVLFADLTICPILSRFFPTTFSLLVTQQRRQNAHSQL